MAKSGAWRKGLLRRIWRRAVFCLVVLAIMFHAAVKFWFGPAYFAAQVEDAISQYWLGPVRVGEIEFGYDGVMLIRDIEFYDLNSTELIRAQGIRVVLGKWPGLDSPAKRIEIEQADVRLRPDAGSNFFPLRRGLIADSEQFTLEYMGIKHATVSAEDASSRVFLEPLFVEVRKNTDRYEFSATSAANIDYNRFRLEGFYNFQNDAVEADLKFARQASRELMKMILSEAGLPQGWDFQGMADGELKVRGNLKDEESLWPEGAIRLEGWTIFEKDNIVAEDVNGLLAVENRRLDFKRMAGLLYKGRFNCSFFVDYRDPGPVLYGVDVLATGIDLAQFSSDWETAKRFTKGTCLLNLKFTADTRGLNTIRGSGAIFIDDADLWRFPVIGELFKVIGVWEYQAGGISDAEVVFNLKGLRMTLERGHLSNRFSAIEAEPGGVINLGDGQINMFVVAMPLKDIDAIVSKMPVMSWFVKFKDKIVRLRLKGHWTQPATQLISKQPIKDVKEGTKAFFRAVIESGGRLGDTVKGGLDFFLEQKPESTEK
jgi:hypothetical protein